MVLLHGLTRNARDFEDLAPRIAAWGRRVIVPDVRGRGRSDRDPNPLNYNPFIYAATWRACSTGSACSGPSSSAPRWAG